MNATPNITPRQAQQFLRQVAAAQGGIIDLSESTYRGDREPIIVRCSLHMATLAVPHAADLCDSRHPYECPLCREHRQHVRKMNKIRLQESLKLQSARHLLAIL